MAETNDGITLDGMERVFCRRVIMKMPSRGDGEAAKRRRGVLAKRRWGVLAKRRDSDGAMALVMRIFELTKQFPSEERYALTDELRRSSRSVWVNLAEAWRKRRYQAAFVSKLNDAEGEAAESQVHIEIAFRHSYLDKGGFDELDDAEFRLTYDGTCWTAGTINPKDINQVQNWFKIHVKKIGVSARRGRRDGVRNFVEKGHAK